jgi:hypothetical protein
MIKFAAAFMLFTAAQSICAQPATEAPTPTTVCALLENPKAWDRKLVQVTGTASHGFEDSGFSAAPCHVRYGALWMSYGGKRQTGTVSTVNENERYLAEPIVVEGITTPLVDDEVFERFDSLLHPPPVPGKYMVSTKVRATVIARFFAGRLEKYPAGESWDGYGHLGCCSLLVIQQVLQVEAPASPLKK